MKQVVKTVWWWLAYVELIVGVIFAKVLATLNLTLATGSLARLRTVGNMIFCVSSVPHDCDST